MKHAENIFNKLMRKHEQLEKCYVNNETINMQINSYAYINITIFWSCLSALYNSCVLLLIIGVLYVHSWCVSCAHLMYTDEKYTYYAKPWAKIYIPTILGKYLEFGLHKPSVWIFALLYVKQCL